MSARPRSWAPYMTWAKHHPAARFDLCGSNLVPCTMEDLPGAREAVELSGANDLGDLPLLDAVAERYGTTRDHVAQAPGASGANFVALAALVRPGDHVVVEWPGYDPHEGAARFLGCDVDRFERRFEDGYALDADRVRAALRPGTRAVVVTDPHNPSGATADVDELRAVARAAERVGARVIVDEVYLDALGDRGRAPAALLGPTFVSTNSLTKSFGLSGLRSGWMIAEPELVERAWRVRDVLDGVGSFPSDLLARVAFRHFDRLLERARSILEPNLLRLTTFMEARADLTWVPPAGGAVAFPRVEDAEDTEAFATFARERHGVGVVPGRLFGDPRHVRVAMSGPGEVFEAGLAALAEALDARGTRFRGRG